VWRTVNASRRRCRRDFTLAFFDACPIFAVIDVGTTSVNQRSKLSSRVSYPWAALLAVLLGLLTAGLSVLEVAPRYASVALASTDRAEAEGPGKAVVLRRDVFDPSIQEHSSADPALIPRRWALTAWSTQRADPIGPDSVPAIGRPPCRDGLSRAPPSV